MELIVLCQDGIFINQGVPIGVEGNVADCIDHPLQNLLRQIVLL